MRFFMSTRAYSACQEKQSLGCGSVLAELLSLQLTRSPSDKFQLVLLGL